LDEQATEHAAAVERSNALANELAIALTARDERETENRALKAEVQHHLEEVKALRTTTNDLSQQVRALLRQIAIMDDPSLASASIEKRSLEDSDDPIADRLVEFESLAALQKKNQKLLRVVRKMQKQIEEAEIAKAEFGATDLDTGVTLDKATETITRLHQQLLETQKKVTEVTRERDVFSKLLSRGEGLRATVTALNGGGPMDDTIGAQEGVMEALRVELETIRQQAEKDVTEIREKLNTKSQEAGQAEVGKARAEAQATLWEGTSILLAIRYERADGQTIASASRSNWTCKSQTTRTWSCRSVKLKFPSTRYTTRRSR
jgi:nucleoprotein TPR